MRLREKDTSAPGYREKGGQHTHTPRGACRTACAVKGHHLFHVFAVAVFSLEEHVACRESVFHTLSR